MEDLDDRDRRVLSIFVEGRDEGRPWGRVTPKYVRERTGLDKGDANTVFVRLGRQGYVEQIERGFYEITERGERELEEHNNDE